MKSLRIIGFLTFAAFGWRISREDMAVGRIRNQWVREALLMCLVGYGFQLIISLAGYNGLVGDFLYYQFYSGALANASISLAFALALWLCGVWPAGDAKFFCVCALFLPLIDPAQRAFPYYLSLNLMVNIFVLAAIYIVLQTAARLARSAAELGMAGSASRISEAFERVRPLLLEKAAAWRTYLPYLLNTAAIFLAQTISRPHLAGRLPRWIASSAFTYLLLVLAWDRVARLIANKQTAVFSGIFLGVAVCAAFFWPPAHGWLGSFAMRWLGFGCFFGAARGLLEWHMMERARAAVEPGGVVPGMILSEKTVSLLRRDPEYFHEHFTPLFKDGLSPAQAEALKQWLMGLPAGQASIEVLQGSPFGAWIFGGTVFTLVMTRDAASLALGLFR